MIIHIEICDVCKRINRGGLPVETVTIPGAIPMTWDVGPCCQQGPFTVVRHTNVIKSHLLARIEALILTELSLLEGPGMTYRTAARCLAIALGTILIHAHDWRTLWLAALGFCTGLMLTRLKYFK